MHPSHLLLSPSACSISPINREDFREGRLTSRISILLSPKIFSFEQNDAKIHQDEFQNHVDQVSDAAFSSWVWQPPR